MKKSELKKYIRENIISELSENTEDEIAKTKELTTAIKDLETAKKEAGIEEGAIDPAEYGDIGVAYLKGFNKPHSLDLDQLEKLGRTIVKRFYKGDFEKAKAKFLKEDEDVVKYKGEDHVITRRDGDRIYLRRKEDAVVLGKMPEFWVKSQDINENEDAEPTKSDIKKTKGLAKAKEELALLTREMKSLAKKYSKAEGADKEKLVKILKDKTKLKKELESILDNKKI